MDDALTKMFKDFDRGAMSRRHLLQTLGIAAVATPIASALGQGSCGGANAGTPRCDTMPWKPLFEPTGWKTVLLDHFTMITPNPEREAAYYANLMGWGVRSNDAQGIMMDIGDWGGVLIRQAPPPPPVDSAAAAAAAAAGGGRGGRGGGGGRGQGAVWDGFAWGIDPWDAKKVEAELKKRGLNPVADNRGKDFQSFHIVDPGGMNLWITNGNKKNRRTTPANAKLSVPAPFEPTGWKTMWLDHISFQSPNYKEAVAFYSALLGWKGTGDEGSQNEIEIGDVGDALLRGANPYAPPGSGGRGGGGRGGRGAADTSAAGRAAAAAAAAAPPPPPRKASFDHIAFGITPWDADAVKAALDKRGLRGTVDTGNKGDIHTAPYKSYHNQTPDGFTLQISNVASKEMRLVR